MSVVLLLIEDYVGGPADQIGYPNLSSCFGATAVSNNGLLAGTHITLRSKEAPLLDRLSELAGTGCSMVLLTGALEKWDKARLQAAVSHMQSKFGDTTPVYGFNTAAIAKETFVLLTSNGAGALPTIEYKNHTKLQYSNPAGAAERLSDVRGWVPEKADTDFARTGGKKLVLHQVKPKKLVQLA